jgi:DNA modification methylase
MGMKIMILYNKKDIPEHLQKYFEPAELGLESTPETYVAKMVAVFNEVRRVLTDDGTCWVNLGDSYARNGGGVECKLKTAHKMGVGQKNTYLAGAMQSIDKVPIGLKEKDLCGIPWRVAFALQSSGWYLRQDIIWHKPNPMPESVKDRCTKAHEYIFLFSKSQKYFCDMDAVKEPTPNDGMPMKTPDGWDVGEGSHGTIHREGRSKGALNTGMINGRNKRSVWIVSTRPFSGAHFAVFPPALIEPCIMAGCPKGGTVIDPFIGSGTTAIVAYKHDRKFIGIDLSQKYLDEIAIPRIEAETRQMKLFN